MKAFSRYGALSSITLALFYGVACGDDDSAPPTARGGRAGTGGATGGVFGGGGAGGTAGASGGSGAGATAGANGSAGTGGTAGTSGSAGAGGTDGANGTSGAAGTAGANGSAGAGGTDGNDGSAGTNGASGTAGIDGSAGTNGASGTAGIDGSAGTNGASGTAGIDGSAGTDGASGSAGIDGSVGTGGTAGLDGGGGTGGSGGQDASAGTGGTVGTNGTGGTGATGGTNGTGGTAGTAGTGGSSGTGGVDGGTTGPTIPQPTGTCPTFTNGTVTFSPAGTAQRSVRIWMNSTAAANQDGPIVLFWYPTGGTPNSATSALGTTGINRIINAGGIVAAPTHIDCGVFPWICGGDIDIRLTDEILACAKRGPGFDSRRIHSLGFSAGALYTTTLSYRRSSYFASVATYSGGGTGTFQENNNKFAAMIFHGGPTDTVVINFQQQSEAWFNSLRNANHFAIICNHNGGHSIPSGGPAGVVQFFFDHPYGTNPSPYATTFPSTVPSYCRRTL